MARGIDGSGSGDDAGLIKAIDWCVGHNLRGGFPTIQILSMSVGIGPTDGNDALSQAIDAVATEHGFIPVASSGNSGAVSTAGSPSVAEKAIGVGSMADWSAPTGTLRHDNGVNLSPYSSRGPVVDGQGNKIRTKPDITGPGSRVTSAATDNPAFLFALSCPSDIAGYVTCSGTSMSTPYVAGVIALMLDADPTLAQIGGDGILPVDKVRQILDATAIHRGPAGKTDEWGAGAIDAYVAVATAAGQPGLTPTSLPLYSRIEGESVADNSHRFIPIETRTRRRPRRSP